MAAIKVNFKLNKASGAEERVKLSLGGKTIVLSFDGQGKDSEILDESDLYFVRWYFLGHEGDEMSVDYSYVNTAGAQQQGELIKSFKLDGRYARPYPGNLWIDEGTTAFRP